MQIAWKRVILFIPFATAISPPFLSTCTEFVMTVTLLTTASLYSNSLTRLFTKVDCFAVVIRLIKVLLPWFIV